MWIATRTPPPKTTGRVVFHADDGEVRAYEHYFKGMILEASEFSGWLSFRDAPFCPAVHTAHIGDVTRSGRAHINVEQMRHIISLGGEIVSHGHVHAFLGYISLTQPVQPGATRVHINYDASRVIKGFSYDIENGETFTAASDERGKEYIDLTEPLTLGYPAGTRFSISYDSAIYNLQTVVDELATLGIECKHHVCAYYHPTPNKEWMQEVFESVVTHASVQTPDDIPAPEDIDLFDIRRSRDIVNWTAAHTEEMLDAVQAKDSVIFVQGHANTDETNIRRLVRRCIEKGIRIVTHSEAVDFIKARKAQQ